MAGYFKKVKTPWTSQPQYPVGLSPVYSPYIVAVISGWNYYIQGRWITLNSTAEQKRAVTKRGIAIETIADGTPLVVTGFPSVSMKEYGFMFVGRRTADTAFDAALEFRVPSGEYLELGTGGGTELGIGIVGMANHFSAGGDLTPRTGAIVCLCSNIAAEGRVYVDGALVSSGYHSVVERAVTSITIGGRGDGSTNRNWRGQQELAVLFANLPFALGQSLSINPWQIFAPQERRVFVSVASSDLNITTILATANASGFTANIDRQLVIVTSLGTATASGFTANIDRQLAISATLATASADGFVSNIDRQLSITTTLATATASGFTANISSDLNVTATLATATASAFSANVDRQLSITTTLATANASGFTANVDRQLFITTTLATATASGFDASIALGGGLNITATRAVATASGFDANITISTPQGSGWETYVAPIRKKTVKQFKEEFNDLTYFELEEKEDEVKSEIRLVEQDIRLNEDLGLDNLILKLKLALKIQKAKLQAIKSVKQEKIQEAQVQQIQHEAIPIEYTQDIDIIHEDENIDADLSYIAAILRMKYFN